MRGQRVNYWEKVKRIQPINWVKEQLKKLFLFLWRKFKRILGIIWVDKQLKKLFLPLWLSRFILVCLSASIGGSFIVYEVICGDNAVDSVFKVLGGGFALIALAIASWRSMITEKQVNSDRFVKSVEQIANQNLAIRLGGLASLHALSKENKEEYQRVWAYLGSFLRHRPPLDKDESTNPFPDVAYIAKMLKERDKKRIEDYESEFKLDLEGANLEGADLDGADLSGADLSGANLDEANLYQANLEGANLRRANLDGADLSGANLDEANLDEANLDEADLRDANLDGAHLWRANLDGADLWGAHLDGANLRDANLDGVDLRGAHLEGAHLWGANLDGADLRGVHLEGADLRRANLEGADLWRAYLEGANLEGAHLRRANLDGVDLVGVDLTMADLSGALFGKTNGVQDLTNLTPDQLKGTYYRNDDGYHAPKLPDNLPEECKPKPISDLQWLEICAQKNRKVS